MFAATLFDYNGVLVDDEAVHLAAFREVLAPLGVPVDEDAYWEKYIGFDDLRAFEEILKDAGRTSSVEELKQFLEAKRPVYLARARKGLKTFPNAAELVQSQAAAGAVAVVSGALRDEVLLGLEQLGVRASIEVIVAAEDTLKSKPDPEGYVQAMERLGIEAADAVVIEDSLAGIAAAKAAGLACIAVAHSYPAKELHASQADLVVPTLDRIDEACLSLVYRRVHA